MTTTACPRWCSIAPDVHAADVADGSSSVVHRGFIAQTDNYVVEVTEDVEGPARVYCYPDPDHDLSVVDARAMAAAVLRACEVIEGAQRNGLQVTLTDTMTGAETTVEHDRAAILAALDAWLDDDVADAKNTFAATVAAYRPPARHGVSTPVAPAVPAEMLGVTWRWADSLDEDPGRGLG